MPNNIEIIQRGESLPFSFDRDGASVDGWTCRIKVKQRPDDISGIDRVITSTDDRTFNGNLSSTETIQLNTGLWHLIGILNNAETDEQEEMESRFHVSKSTTVFPVVANVTYSPPAGTIDEVTPITLSTITVGATIHYTTDGSTPTTGSPTFTAPFTLPVGVKTVKAFAVKVDSVDSNETQAVYTVTIPAFPNISGLFARYSLSDITSVTESGTGISQINDISTFSHHLTQVDDLKRPSYDQSGVPFADFNGTSDNIDSANFLEGAQSLPNTIITVFRLKTNIPFGLIYNGASGNSNTLLSTGTQWRNTAGVIQDYGTSDTLKHNLATIFSTNGSKAYIDGGLSLIQGNLGTEAINKLTVGALDGGFALFSHLELYELVIYNRALSIPELNQIGNYYAINQAITYTDIPQFPTISGLFLRYGLDEAGVVETGTGISLIPDLSTNSHDLIQGTDANRPSFNQALINFADFNGTSDSMDTGVFPASLPQPSTKILIYRLKNTTVGQYMYSGQVTGSQISQTVFVTSGPVFFAEAGTGQAMTTPLDTNKHNLTIIFDGVNSKGYIDGGTNEIAGTLGTESQPELFIGARNDGAFHASLELYAMAVFDRVLTDSEINQVGNYYAGSQSITYTDI